MDTKPDPGPLLTPADMQIVERVLGTNSAYVLDHFNDRTFKTFIQREVGVDATALHYSVEGRSKTDRLRVILRSLSGGQQAKLLRALLEFMDDPVRKKKIGALGAAVRRPYLDLISSLEQQAEDFTKHHTASDWTGRRTLREHAAIIRGLAPAALIEMQTLISVIESQGFNDDETHDALQCLRELHAQLGELISAAERSKPTREAIETFRTMHRKFIGCLKKAQKPFVVAPAMTLGVAHLLSFIGGVELDGGLLGGVYAGLLSLDLHEAIRKRTLAQ
jgi:hypothetical protein